MIRLAAVSEPSASAVTTDGILVRARAMLAAHAAGIVLALFLAAVISAPRWWTTLTDPPQGERVGISVSGAGVWGADEALETQTIRDAYDGHVPVRAPWLVNHNDGPFQVGAFWQEVVGVLGHVLGGPFSSLTIVTTIMAVWGVIALYALAFRLTGSRFAACAILPIALVGVQVFNQADGLFALRRWDVLEPIVSIDPRRNFLWWTRFLSPVMTLGVFLGAVIALPRAVETGKRGWTVAAAVCLALLVYSYIFYWTAMALAVLGWGAWLAWRREWEGLKRLAIVSVLAVIIALPEFAILANKSLNSSADEQARAGQDDLAILPREFAQRLAIALPFIVALWRGPSRNGLFIALILSPLALASVGGLIPQQWHFRTQVWSVFALPALIAGSTVMARGIPSRFVLPSKALLAAAAVGAVAFTLVWQARFISQTDSAYAITDDEAAAFAWIRGNVDGNETVVSPSIATNLLMGSLTPAAEYIMGGYNPVADDPEIIERFLRAQVAFGYGEDETFDRLDPAQGDYDDLKPASDDVLERKLEELGANFLFYAETDEPKTISDRSAAWRIQFRELQSESDVIDPARHYPAEYLYCGHRERYWPVDRAPSGIFVTVAFQQGEVTIYRLAKAGDANAQPFAGCQRP